MRPCTHTSIHPCTHATQSQLPHLPISGAWTCQDARGPHWPEGTPHVRIPGLISLSKALSAASAACIACRLILLFLVTHVHS